ncbi:hypothetical protein [Alkalicoccobacillus porphyridii]|uniref:hypothetical protein n=1 Tax=Alkalicoccobacillus porphyridii TaxID=2597270 RepID=UPI00163DC18B|nr:hypothetical protein [Alkalicoccobacillus porphyridii]
MKQEELMKRMIGDTHASEITTTIIKSAVETAETGLSVQAQAKRLDRQIDQLLKEDV